MFVTRTSSVQEPYSPYKTGAASYSYPGVNAYQADQASIKAVSGDSSLSKVIVGGVAGYKFHSHFISGQQGVIPQAFGAGMGIGALLSGGISVIKNINALTHGRQSAGSAVGNVITDSLQGVVSGAGGVAAGGLSAMAFKAMGVVSATPIAIVGVIGGAIGAVMANKILNTEGLRGVIGGG